MGNVKPQIGGNLTVIICSDIPFLLRFYDKSLHKDIIIQVRILMLRAQKHLKWINRKTWCTISDNRPASALGSISIWTPYGTPGIPLAPMRTKGDLAVQWPNEKFLS